uniref:Titin n=1 Tax=Scophthalmus maximus TaxID=52904 RepID=A0A8D3D0Y7_SCOMX
MLALFSFTSLKSILTLLWCCSLSVAPTIEVDVKLIEGLVLKAGSTITLPAKMTGIPNPTAKWMTDGKEVASEGRYHIETTGSSTILSIPECQRGDTGEYILTVANPAGSKSVALHVTVLDLPGPPIEPINILEVTPDFMMIQWRDLIKMCAYRVQGLTEGMEYRIRIRATNKVGDSEPRELPQTILAKDILVPPEVVVDVSCRDSLTVRAGQIISLITRVKGRPDPEITWTKDARALSRDKRTEMNNNYPLCELVINEAVRSDYGKYAIVAKNSSGQAQATIIVNVLDTPGINLDGTLVVKAGDSIQIEATVKGKPQPDVKWTKDESTEEIKKGPRLQMETGADFSKLLFTNSRRTDSGKYVVTASNSAGTCSAQAKVNVLDRPGPITDLKKCETKKGIWSVHSNAVITNKAKVTRLVEGNEYIFRVRAENKMGPGPAVQSESFVAGTQFSVPDAPEAPEVTKIAKEEMSVQWSEPEKDGGKPITGYLLEKREEHAIRWSPVNKDPVPATRFTVTGLLPLHDYQYRVKAVNEIGIGSPSKHSRAVTAKDVHLSSCIYYKDIFMFFLLSIFLGPPGPPSKPEVEKVDGHSATVTWRRPTEDGGSDIIGYCVEKKEKKAMIWVRASKKSIAELSYEVTSLTEGVEYEFRVLAENKAGFGEPSEPSMPVRTIVAVCK